MTTELGSFAIFILTHGRPDKVVTHRAIRRAGYTGRIIVLIDDEDETADEYRRRFGDEVIQFCKSDVAKRVDTGDLSPDRRAILYARHAAFDVAREQGLERFLQLDDDYSSFSHRMHDAKAEELWEARQMRARRVRDFDAVCAAMLRLLDDTGALTVAMAQGGELIGGVNAHVHTQGWKRKAMNSYFCNTARPIPFAGRLNEDVSAYCLWGSRGELFMTVWQLSLAQLATQQTEGGMSESYRDSGTYVKTFYTVMMCPSFVSVRSIGLSERRIHHHIDWDHAVPKILAPELRKAD